MVVIMFLVFTVYIFMIVLWYYEIHFMLYKLYLKT